jgi:hypothetical protein
MTYRTKTRLIEAFRWIGQPRLNWPDWATPELLSESGSALYAYTTSGPVRVNRGDWCIMGEKEIYPCTNEEFHRCYEKVSLPEGDFDTENLRYAKVERASKTGAPLSGDLDAPRVGFNNGT